jgi:multidrug efflux pump subunit AcrA (membrane-fusion protein)
MSSPHEQEDKTFFGRFGASGEAEADPKASSPTVAEAPEPKADPQPPTEAAQAPKPRSIFRMQAIRHTLAAERPAGVTPLVPPWAGAATWLWAVTTVAALVAGTCLRLEITVRARGAVRPEGGGHPILANASGTAGAVGVKAGDRVEPNSPLLQIISSGIDAQVKEATERLGVATGMAEERKRAMAASIRVQMARVQDRLAQTLVQIDSQKASVAFLEKRKVSQDALLKKGLVSALDAAAAADAVENGVRGLASLVQAEASLRAEAEALAARKTDVDLAVRENVMGAEAHFRGTSVLAMDATVLASESGIVDTLLVHSGDSVRAGQTVARIIPSGVPLRVVAFVAERDRADLKVGDAVALEIDRLPKAEFGEGKGRILRVATDVSPLEDIRDTLGDGQVLGAVVRVDVEITAFPKGKAATAGTALTARFVTKRRTPLAILMDPILKRVR